MKLQWDPLINKTKVIYMLGGLTKDKIEHSLSKEEFESAFINAETEILYGNIYLSELEIDQFKTRA
jgi:hypothetical protein